MSRIQRLLLAAVLTGGLTSEAAAMRVCLEDRAGIGVPGRAGLVRELHALLPQIEVDLGPCSALGGSDVVLTVLDSRPGIPADALGLAYRAGGAILPRLELFVEPVMQLTQAGDWETVGRALARVAAHELLHYRKQSGGHGSHGLLQARLTARELVSEELRPRLAASLHHD